MSPYNIPQDISDFQEEHYIVLRRLNKHPVNEPFSGLITRRVDIPHFIPILMQLNLIEIAPFSTALSYFKLDSLKGILKHHNLKISGNKNDLIQRILDNITENEIRQDILYTDFYIVTERGKKLLRDSIEKIEQEKLVFFKDIIISIASKNLQEAYRKINNSATSNPNLISCAGLSKSFAEKNNLIYEKLLASSPDILVSSSAIFSQLVGWSLSDVRNLFEKAYPGHDSTRIFYESSILSNLIDLQSCKEGGSNEYVFLASLDKETCPICGLLDKKVFKIKEAKIGTNCPPMHLGCRCVIIAKTSKKDSTHMKRLSRNPVTNKSEYIPENTSYTEWIKNFK